MTLLETSTSLNKTRVLKKINRVLSINSRAKLVPRLPGRRVSQEARPLGQRSRILPGRVAPPRNATRRICHQWWGRKNDLRNNCGWSEKHRSVSNLCRMPCLPRQNRYGKPARFHRTRRDHLATSPPDSQPGNEKGRRETRSGRSWQTSQNLLIQAALKTVTA